jgi:hypothetical protein
MDAVLHLEFQNDGGLSPTQLKNVGDLKKCGGHTFTLQYDLPKRIHLFYIEAFLTAIVRSTMEIEKKILTNTTLHTGDDPVC